MKWLPLISMQSFAHLIDLLINFLTDALTVCELLWCCWGAPFVFVPSYALCIPTQRNSENSRNEAVTQLQHIDR